MPLIDAKTNPGRDWLAFRRCLILLRRLASGPATSAELVEEVLHELGPDAYSPELKARNWSFKLDRKNLRDRLGIDINYDRSRKVYFLDTPDPFTLLKLSPAGLQGLRLLMQTFNSTFSENNAIHSFIDEIVQRLSPTDRSALETHPSTLEIDLMQDVDTSSTSTRVWSILERAIREGRRLSFNYRSPQQADGLPRYHEVAPYRIRFQRGHWYLHACDLLWRSPDGFEKIDSTYRNFRLSYILDDERLAVLPARLPPFQRTPPRYELHYRLLPALGRGAISQHFEEMHIQHLPDGSAEVHAVTDDAWEAVRIFLGYGENCIVLGEQEIRARMEERVRKMAANYGL